MFLISERYETAVRVPVTLSYNPDFTIDNESYCMHISDVATQYDDGLIVAAILVEVRGFAKMYLGKISLMCVIDNKISRFEKYSIIDVFGDFDVEAVYAAITTGENAIRVSI